MARASTQTVFGFGCSLDWRPTSFVPAFPSTRVCSACGLVPPATATLPCRHLLCELCYRGRASGSDRCPLDKETFQEEDVVWSSRIRKDSLLSRKVRCWNADNGCSAEGAASVMLGHFNVCRFHVVSCPRCCGRVPHLEMADHLESCRAPPNLPGQPALDDNFVNAALEVREALRGISEKCTSIESKLESFQERLPSFRDDSIAELSAILNQTARGAIESATETSRVETGALLAEHWPRVGSQIGEALAERERSTVAAVAQECNRKAESVNREVADQTSTEAQNNGRTAPFSSARSRLISDVSRKITKCREKLMKKEALSGKDAAKLLKMLALSSLAVTNDALDVSESRECTIRNWEMFRSRLTDRGCIKHVSPSAYFYGYRLFIELSLDSCTDELRLQAFVREGLYDEFVDWPVNVKLRVHIIHPTDESKNLTLGEQFTWEERTTDDVYPQDEVPYQTSSHRVSIGSLERGGFTSNNGLRVEYEFVR
ncbi:TNF receptor-associated factor 6-like [Dermacentor albipictus]|uniref:TNF receptor-associated factor 6-like n=1 Tax=Dermacentor albipictus TaxID=60249 RepID=UPI0031FC5522